MKNGLNEKFKPFFILWNILTTVVENDIIFLIIILSRLINDFNESRNNNDTMVALSAVIMVRYRQGNQSQAATPLLGRDK